MQVFRTGEFAKQRGRYNSSNSAVEEMCKETGDDCGDLKEAT